MAVIPESYYNEEKIVRLTEADIDLILEQLSRAEYNIYTNLQYDKLADKLKEAKDGKLD